jgi:phospholipid transport system substrate-binding protein
VRAKQHILRVLSKRLAVGALIGAAFVNHALAAANGPQAVIEHLHTSLLEVMQNAHELGYEGRYQELAPVLEQSYDFPFMIRVALGPTWRDLNEAQRAELTELFTDMSIANYAARFDGYGGERFEILGERPGPRDAVLVQSRIVRPNEEPIELNYLLREFEDGWRIIDVLLDARYSELARQRAEFAAVLRSGGVPDLVATLERKIAQLTAEG